MNLLQKLGLIHNIEDYAFVEYTTNSGCGVIAFVRHIGNSNYKSLKTKKIINSSRINFIKSLTDYICYEKQYISDNKAQILANSYYTEFSQDYTYYIINQRDEIKENYTISPIVS